MKYSIFILSLTLLPLSLFAQVNIEYSPLIIDGGLDTSDLGSYINSLYLLSISVAALLATIKLIIAGAKYMLSDVITTQGEAKKEIQNSLLGLLLVISAVLILTIINPQIISNRISIIPVAKTELPLDALTSELLNDLFTGIDACVERNQPVVGENGLNNVTAANASGCTDSKAQLALFEKNCEKKGGVTKVSGTDSNIMNCSTVIPGSKEAATFIKSLGSLSISGYFGDVQLTDEFVSQNGNIVTTNVAGACSKVIKPSNSAVRDLENCSKIFEQMIDNECDGYAFLSGSHGAYGKYDGNNPSNITCQIPGKISKVNELTDAFEKWKAAEPSRRNLYVLDAISDEDIYQEICEGYAGGKYFDENPWKYDSCAFY